MRMYVSIISFHCTLIIIFQFKRLNSQLHREVVDFDRARAAGTHTLATSTDPYGIYEPTEQAIEVEAWSHVLDGSSTTSIDGDSRDDMRKRMLEATVRRLQREEEELENSCGTGHSTSNKDASTSG
jgi:hypothetical protein